MKGFLRDCWGMGLKCRPFPQTPSPARRCKNTLTKTEDWAQKVVPYQGFGSKLELSPVYWTKPIVLRDCVWSRQNRDRNDQSKASEQIFACPFVIMGFLAHACLF